MFLELLSNAFLDSSFLYLYLGIVLVTFSMIYVSNLYTKHFMNQHYIFGDHHQHTKINVIYIEKPLKTNESFVVWIIITVRRIDEKDDKQDKLPTYYKSKFKIRGAKLWMETAYSPSLKNIAF